MTRDELLALAERCANADPQQRLKFSLCMGEGWITSGRESVIRLLCHMWNARLEISAALRAQAASMEDQHG